MYIKKIKFVSHEIVKTKQIWENQLSTYITIIIIANAYPWVKALQKRSLPDSDTHREGK